MQYFGSTFAPHASHTLDIRTEFTTASPNGDYQYDLAYSADPCGMNELGMNFEYSTYAKRLDPAQPNAVNAHSGACSEYAAVGANLCDGEYTEAFRGSVSTT